MTFLCYKQKSRVGCKKKILYSKTPQSSSTRRDVRCDEMLETPSAQLHMQGRRRRSGLESRSHCVL